MYWEAVNLMVVDTTSKIVIFPLKAHILPIVKNAISCFPLNDKFTCIFGKMTVKYPNINSHSFR